MLAGGKIGREEKSSIHVADVIRISDSNSRIRGGSSDTVERKTWSQVLTWSQVESRGFPCD
jgi:hypothetical protein